MAHPKVSIIVPLYNKAPYVTKALESILFQTYKDWECVVVNDGSTDKSADVVRDVICKMENGIGEKFHLINQENAGVSVARNRGIAESMGEYVCFLDADDWWAPEYIAEMMGLVNGYPNAGIYGCNYYYVRRGEKIMRLNFPTGYMDYFKVYADTCYMPLWTGAVMMKKTVAEEFGGFPVGMILGEDTYLWMHVVLKYGMAWLNTPLAYYNNDVLQETRGIVKDKIYKPETFLTFRLCDFADAEQNNADVKRLFDRMRCYSLERYLEQNAYPEQVAKEISKVDWNNVEQKYWRMYNLPYPVVKTYFIIRRLAYTVYCKIRKK